jgi:hypothetical protein
VAYTCLPPKLRVLPSLKLLRRLGFDPFEFIVHQSVPREEFSAFVIQSTWPSGV